MPRAQIIAPTYATREEWLFAAAERLRPDFTTAEHPLPDKIQFSMGFSSKGMGKTLGQHWHAAATADGTHHIFIVPTLNDPVEVLDVLVHELCHAAAPAGAKHGPLFGRVRYAMGLTEGKAIHASAGPALLQSLGVIAAMLGPLPHAQLMPVGKATKPAAKQPECVCPHCGYKAIVGKKFWTRFGAPYCGNVSDHYDYPEDWQRMDIIWIL
jgi:hypothetical protein